MNEVSDDSSTRHPERMTDAHCATIDVDFVQGQSKKLHIGDNDDTARENPVVMNE